MPAPRLLVLTDLAPSHRALLAQDFDLTHAPDETMRAAAIAEHGQEFDAVLTMGTIGLTAAEMDRMPKLRLVACQGTGYEKLDLAAARARGIPTCNGAGANAPAVADHAFALLLGAVRAVPRMDAAARRGLWRNDQPLLPGLTGKKLGLIGLGAVGRQVARRALGFDLEVGYHTRNQAAEAPYPYFSSVLELAAWADYLVAAIPGSPATRHLIDAPVLDALGPQGFLVNVARGSVVDTAALVAALRAGAIQGAALDVFENEPGIEPELTALDNVVLSPHLGAWSQEAMDAMVLLFLENARRHFAGQPLLTPI